MNSGDTFTIPEAPGCTFRVSVEDDDCKDPPWECCDGHGPVRQVYAYYGRPEKRPGERILHEDRGTYWLYDWEAACKMAREDGWNAAPYDAPNRIERAVQADFDYLRGWLTDQWNYVGVCVRMIDDNDEPITGEYDHALWGIESDAKDYIEETAHELALQCAEDKGRTTEQRRASWLAALKERREVLHWAARDVLTT